MMNAVARCERNARRFEKYKHIATAVVVLVAAVLVVTMVKTHTWWGDIGCSLAAMGVGIALSINHTALGRRAVEWRAMGVKFRPFLGKSFFTRADDNTIVNLVIQAWELETKKL